MVAISMLNYLTETFALFHRRILHAIRQPFWVFSALFQPAIWLFLFSSLFQKMVTAAMTRGDYRTFMTAGVIVMTIQGNTLMAGIPLVFDKELGFINKLLSAPIHRSSIIASTFLYIIVQTVVQILIILGAAATLGVRVATGVSGIAMLTLVGLALGAGITMISLALAFKLRGHGEFFGITGFLSLPLIFVSSALAPVENMPDWMQFIAKLNPMTHAIDGVRSLVMTGWNWNQLGQILLALLVFDALCLVASVRVFRKNLT
jgi:ABC-2 type transport system permease protein